MWHAIHRPRQIYSAYINMRRETTRPTTKRARICSAPCYICCWVERLSPCQVSHFHWWMIKCHSSPWISLLSLSWFLAGFFWGGLFPACCSRREVHSCRCQVYAERKWKCVYVHSVRCQWNSPSARQEISLNCAKCKRVPSNARRHPRLVDTDQWAKGNHYR